MLIDDIIIAGRKLKSFIEKLEPNTLTELNANSIRSKDTFNASIQAINSINVDAFILIIRYYNTLSVDYRSKLVDSLNIKIDIKNIASIELVDYSKLNDTEKIIFEIIYTLSILNGSTDN